jgi:hypothetical protein
MLIVLILLIILLFGGGIYAPAGPYRTGGISLAGLILIILLVWLLAGPGWGWRPLW